MIQTLFETASSDGANVDLIEQSESIPSNETPAYTAIVQNRDGTNALTVRGVGDTSAVLGITIPAGETFRCRVSEGDHLAVAVADGVTSDVDFNALILTD